METETNVQITVKTEIVDPEIDGKATEIPQSNGSLGDFKRKHINFYLFLF